MKSLLVLLEKGIPNFLMIVVNIFPVFQSIYRSFNTTITKLVMMIGINIFNLRFFYENIGLIFN